MNNVSPILADRITEARRESGLGTRDFASRVGVSQRSIQNWEKGVKEPRNRQLRLLAEATGHPVAWFWTNGN